MSMTGAAQALTGPRETARWPVPDLASAGLARSRRAPGDAPDLPRMGHSAAEVIALNRTVSRRLPNSPLWRDTPGPENGQRAAAARGAAPRVVAAPRAGSREVSPRRVAPLRLTRRGRLVAGALLAITAIVLVALLSAVPAGGLTGAGHQPSRAGYRGMTQVVVRPGQSLWSIAVAAEPSSDPRAVIQQIVAANALRGQSVEAGQLLWIPRG